MARLTRVLVPYLDRDGDSTKRDIPRFQRVPVSTLSLDAKVRCVSRINGRISHDPLDKCADDGKVRQGGCQGTKHTLFAVLAIGHNLTATTREVWPV